MCPRNIVDLGFTWIVYMFDVTMEDKIFIKNL